MPSKGMMRSSIVDRRQKAVGSDAESVPQRCHKYGLRGLRSDDHRRCYGIGCGSAIHQRAGHRYQWSDPHRASDIGPSR